MKRKGMTNQRQRVCGFSEQLLHCRVVANTPDSDDWMTTSRKVGGTAPVKVPRFSSPIVTAKMGRSNLSPSDSDNSSNAATAGSDYSRTGDLCMPPEGIKAVTTPVSTDHHANDTGKTSVRKHSQRAHWEDEQFLLRSRVAPTRWALHAPAEFTTATDMSPSLCSAFRWYTDEVAAAMTSQSCEEGSSVPQEGSRAYDFIKLRLFPTDSVLSLASGEIKREQTAASTALVWLLQQQREVAATALLMGFSFLLGLQRYDQSWKNALEVPITALQLLANHAFALNEQGSGKTISDLTARDHLLFMSACLLISWKYADVNADVEDLVTILDKHFFDQHVFSSSEVLRLEAVVLKSTGLYVAPPRWWRVAIELLAAAHADEEEWALRVGHSRRDNGFARGVHSCYETKLQQLLISSERVLLFLMDETEGDDSQNPVGTPWGETDSCLRECRREPIFLEDVRQPHEVRGTLCQWLQHHPLFGAALAVASNAITCGWAAAHIGPAAAGSNRTPLRVADTTAQREMLAMAAVLVRDVFHPPSTQLTE
ncbi:hypothetical protein DPX39_090042100 [Trypanosoma brucei equiperdum]|uniref:Cyclin n=1 Tax=Trypanosoma brucei equiperdum TaxID=630700 RepID=A0A3L6L475_9TRYP|nr:hypothetical protein DPX39_090042100 [Trypanosoma brucei equiperdum]